MVVLAVLLLQLSQQRVLILHLLVLQRQLAVVWGDITRVLGLLVVAVVQAVVVAWMLVAVQAVKVIMVGLVLPMWVVHQLLEVVVVLVRGVAQVSHLPPEMVEMELHHL